ncbi:MAG: heme ABC exporter ATP-binding protein CcmA [Chloroflexota bacterium]
MTASPTVVVRNLTKRFGLKSVLRSLDFQAEAGEFIALLGPNGTGKTTFLRILASLTRFTQGDIQINGYRLPAQSALIRQQLGFVSHQPLLYGDLSAIENLQFYGRMYGITGLDARINEILEMVGLLARRSDYVRTYSRGMQQRLSIGRAILHRPALLLFDEPYTGLDQEACNILDVILRKVTASGHTIIMTSHDLARTSQLAARFDVMLFGKIISSFHQEDIPSHNLAEMYEQILVRELETPQEPQRAINQ